MKHLKTANIQYLKLYKDPHPTLKNSCLVDDKTADLSIFIDSSRLWHRPAPGSEAEAA